MQGVGRVPVRFERPPVLEVACGVAFGLSKALKTAHIGLYWSRRRDDFPRCEDAAPISMTVEGAGPADSTEMSVQVEHVTLPPLRRAWLINAAGTHLLQLQEDRFLFNWKATDADRSYPSYDQVIAGFRDEWAKFKAFIASEGLGTPAPVQLELTYFNFWPGTFSWLRDCLRDESAERFLRPPGGATWKTVYDLPESCGRLHVTAASARHSISQERGVRLDLVARGLPRDTSEAGCQQWFDLAHEWITHGFADLTTAEAHGVWGRTA